MAFDIEDKLGTNLMAIMADCLRTSVQEPLAVESVDALLDYIGTSFKTERIELFEPYVEGFYFCAYEWLANSNGNALAAKLKHLDLNVSSAIYEHFEEDMFYAVSDIETIKESDPYIYEYFKQYDIKSLMLCQIRYQGTNLGFFSIDNIEENNLTRDFFTSIGYILGSALFNRNIFKRLAKIGVVDKLTHVGNRQGLYEYVDDFDTQKSIGVILSDIVSLKSINEIEGQAKGDEAIVTVSKIWERFFGSEAVYRIGGDEFLVVLNGSEQRFFMDGIDFAIKFFDQKNISVAIGWCWNERFNRDLDDFIDIAHLNMYENKREYYTGRENSGHLITTPDNISVLRNDEFFRQARLWMGSFDTPDLIVIAVDVNYFKLYRDIYGIEAAGHMLGYTSKVINKFALDHEGICGYLGGDDFAIAIPYRGEDLKDIEKDILNNIVQNNFPDGFYPACGVYFGDISEDIEEMYTKAIVTLNPIKGNYNTFVRFFDSKRYVKLRDTHLMLIEVKDGLARGEFTFYIQPKVNLETGKVVGGEALTRWAKNGEIIQAYKFIPTIEMNGYVVYIDKFVWEEVCIWIRAQLDRGLTPPMISVNVSRVDFNFIDVPEFFDNLLKKYDLPHEYIEIEITESAYIDAPNSMMEEIRRLRNMGFRISIDDFGSGYSSLEMLGSMQVDVVKFDKKFIDNASNDYGYNILKSISEMMKVLGLEIIVEGAETKEQIDILKSVDCKYVQGFYFFEPLTKEEFEKVYFSDND
ncbi:MAG: bifunctional diguanylate cyclase/phosphodiesterase [Eubacterium sp.]|nr:bifunctional diguanylate cyclase/phosphodiesterase [Eubacterium sp.]